MYRYQFLVLLLLPFILYSQVRIEGEYSPREDFNFNLLYQETPIALVYKLGAQNHGNGTFSFDLDSTFQKGIYKLIYDTPLDERFFYIVHDGESDVFYSYTDEKGAVFHEVQNQLLSDYIKSRTAFIEEMNGLIRDGANHKKIKKAIEEFQVTEKTILNKSEGKFVATYFNSLKYDFPNDFSSTEAYLEYYKSNFFSNFNFQEAVIQASHFPFSMLSEYYITLSQHSELINLSKTELVENITNQVKDCEPLFQRKVLGELWDYIVKIGDHVVANELADYLIPIAEEVKDRNLTAKLVDYKRLSTGAIAPDFMVGDSLNPETLSLHNLEGAEFYLLAFWNSRCGHCVRQMPELNFHISSFEAQKLNSIAIGFEADSASWLEEKARLTDFTNNFMVTGDDRVRMRKAYDVKKTPYYFILDKDKKIVIKTHSLEELLEKLNEVLKE